jgi:hypothetical protein
MQKKKNVSLRGTKKNLGDIENEDLITDEAL